MLRCGSIVIPDRYAEFDVVNPAKNNLYTNELDLPSFHGAVSEIRKLPWKIKSSF